ncbi:hypothetical protein ACP2W0_18485 [Pseudobacillus badius]|uniref:hypothetical protein n=1 Tax=Bacillus badius TaxID=1455 RepID=UPI003CEFBFC5
MTIKPSAEVGEAVRHLLAEKDMTNEQMADDLNISKQLVREEKESIAQMMDKLLEARMFIDNFMMAIERDYGIPMKKRMRRLVLQWKANRWLA